MSTPKDARLLLFSVALSLGLLSISVAKAQTVGIQPFSTQFAEDVTSIDLASGNVFVNVPVRGKRGFTYSLVGNSGGFGSTNLSGNFSLVGVTTSSKVADGRFSYGETAHTCGLDPRNSDFTMTSPAFVDSTGASHPFTLSGAFFFGSTNCPQSPVTGLTKDGTGYSVVITPSNGGFLVTVYDRSGDYSNLFLFPNETTPDNTPSITSATNAGHGTIYIRTLWDGPRSPRIKRPLPPLQHTRTPTHLAIHRLTQLHTHNFRLKQTLGHLVKTSGPD